MENAALECDKELLRKKCKRNNPADTKVSGEEGKDVFQALEQMPL